MGEGIRIVRGCDFHLMLDNIQDALAHPTRYTINAGPYLLMELSDMMIFPNTGQMWQELEDAGMRIILTHPERNPLLQDQMDRIEEWVAQGRYMQLTAQSLLGQFGPQAQRFAVSMLEKGLAHFVASDGHDLRGRPPRLDLAFDWVAARYGRELAQLLFVDAPARRPRWRAGGILDAQARSGRFRRVPGQAVRPPSRVARLRRCSAIPGAVSLPLTASRPPVRQ